MLVLVLKVFGVHVEYVIELDKWFYTEKLFGVKII